MGTHPLAYLVEKKTTHIETTTMAADTNSEETKLVEKGLVFLVRRIRVDMEQAVNALCREVTRWTVGSDMRLTRIFGYLLETEDFGLVFRVSEAHSGSGVVNG